MMRVLEYSSLLRTTTPSMMAPKIPVDPNFWPSLYQPKVMGRLPSKIWHETADLIPSLSNLLGKRKGMMVGGAETSPIKHQLKLTCLRWGKKKFVPYLRRKISMGNLWRQAAPKMLFFGCHKRLEKRAVIQKTALKWNILPINLASGISNCILAYLWQQN